MTTRFPRAQFALYAAIVVFFFACGLFSPFDDPPVDETDLLWVETMPVQCLGNPWQQEWLKEHGNNYDEYPRGREQEVLAEFFLKRGAVFYAYRTVQVWAVACAGCSCPEGNVLALKVHQGDLALFEQFGFRLSGANLRLKMDKAVFHPEEAVTFELINSSKYSFTANGEDGFGMAGLLVVKGSDFGVQQEQEGYWQYVELPPAFEGTRRFTIAPNDSMRGYWLNFEKRLGRFRLLLRVHPEGEGAQERYVISESFTIADDLIPFDPQPQALDFGDAYTLRPDSSSLQGDFLKTVASYSGGCKPHAFEVRLQRVENLTAYIFIHHNGNGDLCEAYLTTPLRANLAPLLQRDDWDRLVLIAPNGIEVTLVGK
ncbi:MAG: hypothetical protein ACREOO_00080 [bacterium]